MPVDYRQSQFSDQSIPFDTAVGLCGPAAAIAFMRVNGGQPPTLRQAMELAKKVGWTTAGMAGPQSQKALLDLMDKTYGTSINAQLESRADWQAIAASAQGGKLTTVSTPEHYFTISGYDPATNKYFVGTSGTDMKKGSDWMSAADIERVGKGVNGVLHMGGTQTSEQQRFNEANAAPQPDTPTPIAPSERPVTQIEVSPPVAPIDVPSSQYAPIKPLGQIDNGLGDMSGVQSAQKAATDQAATEAARAKEQAEYERKRKEAQDLAAGQAAFNSFMQPKPMPAYRLPALDMPEPPPLRLPDLPKYGQGVA